MFKTIIIVLVLMLVSVSSNANSTALDFAKRTLLGFAERQATELVRDFLIKLALDATYSYVKVQICSDTGFLSQLKSIDTNITIALQCPPNSRLRNRSYEEAQPAPSNRSTLEAGLATDRFVGKWRFPKDGLCDRRFGLISVDDNRVLFEWHMPNGSLNVAVERIDLIHDNVIYTTVLYDVGTPTPETGQRIRYTVSGSSWTSENLTTRARNTHLRC